MSMTISVPPQLLLERILTLEIVRVTERAAVSAARLRGHGNEKAADQAAVDAMRRELNKLPIEGTVVIGEGERDEAPMLYIGEKVGAGGPKIDIALDPLEGTTITAKGLPNGLAVMAMAEHGGFLNAPDVYMDKIAVGGGEDGDGVGRAGGAEVRALERVDGDVHLRGAGAAAAHLLADVEHRRLVALALADDDRAVDRHGVHHLAHRFDGDLVGLVAVALPHRVPARNRGLFDHPEKLEREIGVHYTFTSPG